MDSHDWDRRYQASDLLWSAGPNRWLVEEAAGLPAGEALDVACGEGRNALWLAEQGWRVVAVDFSAVGLDKARQMVAARPAAGNRVTWVEADVLAYRPEPGGYDLVLLAYLQLAAAARRAALLSAVGAVRPGGVLLVIAHDSANLTDGVGGPQDPAVLYTPEDVVADLALGPAVVVERAVRVRRPVETAYGQRSAIDAVVRARAPR